MTLIQRSSRLIHAAVMALAFIPVLPLQAQTVDELQRQLEAQQQISAQLRQRVVTLEETIEQMQAEEDSEGGAPVVSPRPQFAGITPPDDILDYGDLGALEQALVQRGTSILPAGTGQIIPSTSWSHSGTNFNGSTSNAYSSNLSARMGLPMGFMVGASVPYILHSENPNGDNNGIGDISVSLTKQLLAQTDERPSLLAQIDYVAPTGEDPFETAVPLGSGFHTVGGSLSSVKSIDPLAFYGNISYAHSFSRNVQGTSFKPGDVISVGAGSTLAATPEIALSLGMNFAFVNHFEADGVSLSGTDRTIGTVNVGAGFLLSQRVYLSIFGQFGVTDDAPDLGIGIALPIRF